MTQEKANSKAELFKNMFQFQEGIYQNTLENLTDELAIQRPTDKSNHTNWLLGHILHCRYMLANMIGVEAENPFGTTYWGTIENKDYPKIREVTKHFLLVSSFLSDKLSKMTDADLNAKPAPDKPSTADIVSFFVYHEAYHLGQIGYARKMIGLEALKSN